MRAAARARSSSLRALAEGGEALQREFRVHDERPVVARQRDRAIGPPAVRERRLEAVGPRRQRVADDRLHPPLAERPARLLVGEHVLQRQHLPREVGEALLRGVDHGKPFVELRQVLDRLLHVLLQAVSHTRLQRVEALCEQAHEVGLARAEHLVHRLHAPGHLGLDARDLSHLLVELALPLGRRRRLQRPLARGTVERDSEHEQPDDGDAGEPEQRLAEGDAAVRDDEDDPIHRGSLAAIRSAGENESGTIDPSPMSDYVTLALAGTFMSIRPIIILPDPKLRLVSEAVGTVTPDLRALIDDMFETMYDAPGIGLAAIQIGIPQRIVTVDTARQDEPKKPLALINPQIVWSSPELSTYEEGCLSIPEYYEEVERPAKVRVTFTDRDGAACEIEADGLLATCLQHEIDHLDGKLFIDHISRLKRERVMKKFQKAAKREGGA